MLPAFTAAGDVGCRAPLAAAEFGLIRILLKKIEADPEVILEWWLGFADGTSVHDRPCAAGRFNGSTSDACILARPKLRLRYGH
jgi:hypothetical protein